MKKAIQSSSGQGLYPVIATRLQIRGATPAALLGKRPRTCAVLIATTVGFQIAKSALVIRPEYSLMATKWALAQVREQIMLIRVKEKALEERYANYVIASSTLERWYQSLF